MKKNVLRAIVFLALVIVFSCRKDLGKIDYGGAYPAAIGRIIANNCAVSGCHNTASYIAAGRYNLESWDLMFRGSANGSPVIPFNSAFSSFCSFINTYPDLGLQNEPTMPLNGKRLSYQEVKLIKDWVDNGAPDINGKIMWADKPNRKKFYAVNQGCDVVTVFDAETKLPMRYIEVGTKPSSDAPHQVRVSPDGKYWYVIFINNNILQKFRCSDDSYVGAIPLTPLAAGSGSEDAVDWNTFTISKDGKRAYCASWIQNGHISAVNLESMSLIRYSPALYYPHGIILNASEDQLYVTSQTGNFITQLDTAFTEAKHLILNNSIIPDFNSSIDPHEMILSPDGADILITCQASNDVRVFNVSQEKVTTVITTGQFPQEIVYSKGTNQYIVSCTEDVTSFPGRTGVLTRIDAGNYSTETIPCGHQPHGMAVDETRNILYVLSRNASANGPAPHHTSACTGRNGFVNFIDLNTFSILPGRYELSVDPYFIDVRP